MGSCAIDKGKEVNMSYGIQIVNGFLFFLGGVLAVAAMHHLFGMALCH